MYSFIDSRELVCMISAELIHLFFFSMLPLLIKDGLMTAYVASSVAFIVFAYSCIETHTSAGIIFPDNSNTHSLGKSLLQFVVCCLCEIIYISTFNTVIDELFYLVIYRTFDRSL